MFKHLFAPVFLTCIGLTAVANVPNDPAGVLSVIDADTVDVGGVRVRLFGIDAPEIGQTCTDAAGADWPCGDWAAQQVMALYQGDAAQCAAVDTDRYGRTVARCTVQGLDIGAILVSAGLATAYRDYSTDYVATEAAAKAQRLGIWAGTMQEPAAYRHRDQDPAPGDCAIKGNISDHGQIYHLPGSRSYAGTRIDEARGERWFCTEADAQQAGWRPARD
jgi:endonuclease YncB( thermonuclease family)